MKTTRYITFIVTLTALLLCSCQPQSARIHTMQADSIVIDSTLDAIQDTAYLRALAPITEQLNRELNVVIGYAPRDMKAELPESELLNWASDALYEKAAELYHGDVDFAVVNVGGIRCTWSKGNITRRNVFELMPFDNALVVLTLTGDQVLKLCQCFAANGGQGVSRQLRMTMHPVSAEAKQPKYTVSQQDIRIKGKPINEEAVYYVATSDYLSTGADHLTPLAHYIEKHETNRLIRDLYMEYIIQKQTVEARTDGRMKYAK